MNATPTRTCPSCGTEYLQTVAVCRRCAIDLASGHPVVESEPCCEPRFWGWVGTQGRRWGKAWRRPSTWVLAAGLIGVFGVLVINIGVAPVLLSVALGFLIVAALVVPILVS